MKTLGIFAAIMVKMSNISKPFHKFLAHLALVFVVLRKLLRDSHAVSVCYTL